MSIFMINSVQNDKTLNLFHAAQRSRFARSMKAQRNELIKKHRTSISTNLLLKSNEFIKDDLKLAKETLELAKHFIKLERKNFKGITDQDIRNFIAYLPPDAY